MRVAKGGFSGLEAPKIFGLRFGDESHHRNSSTVLSGCVCVCGRVWGRQGQGHLCVF